MANNNDVIGYIHSVDSFGAVDGPGIRFVVFLQGCPLRCLYCHNPDSWKFKEGQKRSANDLMQEKLGYKSYIRRGGVTLSGGEPFAQMEFVKALLSLCREHGIHTAVDTSGAIPLEVSKEGIDLADMLLLDLKAIDPQECLSLTGQDNRHALQTLAYCEQTGKKIWLRHVCVPGYTLDSGKLAQMADYLKSFQCVDRVELIPFHQMGSYKWEYLDTPYRLGAVEPPSAEEMEQAKELFRTRGLNAV